jgi:hypothetical protein
VDAEGNNPFRDWLDSLDLSAKARVQAPSVDRANPAINRHRKTGHFVAAIETEEFYCEAVS